MKILIKFAWVLFAVLLLLKCIGCTRLPWWKVFLPLGVVAGGWCLFWLWLLFWMWLLWRQMVREDEERLELTNILEESRMARWRAGF